MKSSHLRSRKGLTLSGSAQLSGALTNTSAAGAFVATRYEVDTTLCQSWQQAGQLFVKWRIIKLKFEFRPIKGTTTNGNMGIVFLPDPNMTTPGTTSAANNNEKVSFGHIYQNVQLVVTPKHSGWLFTRDGVATTDDRLEMPGDVVFWSDNTDAAFAPGIAMMHYTVQFDEVANSTVAPAKPKKLVTGVTPELKLPSLDSDCQSEKETKVLNFRTEISKGTGDPSAVRGKSQTDIEDIPPEVLEIARRIHRMRQKQTDPNSNPNPNYDLV